MEFVKYLNATESEVYVLIRKKVSVEENASICRKQQILGFFNAETKKLTMCTISIFKNWNPRALLNETLMHETVHVAQSCKSGFRFLESFGVKASHMPLNREKEGDLRKVVAFDARLRQIDREAFWMEDKPGMVKYVVEKYCKL